MYYIYRTTNLINGKTYIGQHKCDGAYDYYLGSGKLLKQAFKKYGKENFSKEIIIKGNFTKEQIDKFERCMIFFERFNGKSEYNIDNGGNSAGVHSKETRQKISKGNKGRKVSEETKRKIADFRKGKPSGMLGKHHSEGTKKKISESHKNPSEETRRKISEAMKERRPTEETRRKMIEIQSTIAKLYKEYKVNGGTLSWHNFRRDVLKKQLINI